MPDGEQPRPSGDDKAEEARAKSEVEAKAALGTFPPEAASHVRMSVRQDLITTTTRRV